MIQSQPSQILVNLPFQIIFFDARKTLWTQFSGSKNRIATRRWNLGGQKIDEKFLTYRIGNRPKPKPTKQSGNTNFVKKHSNDRNWYLHVVAFNKFRRGPLLWDNWVGSNVSPVVLSFPLLPFPLFPSSNSPPPPPPRTRRFFGGWKN